MNKNIFLAFVFSVFGVLLADPPNWQDDVGAYEFTATLVAGLVLISRRHFRL